MAPKDSDPRLSSLDGVKAAILSSLRAASRNRLGDEARAWRLVEALDARHSVVLRDIEPCKRLEAYVYFVALLYTGLTGAFPAFTNCDNETLFERFLFLLPMPLELRATRNLVRAAIRKLDAKRNVEYLLDVQMLDLNQAASETENFLTNSRILGQLQAPPVVYETTR